MVAIYQPKIVRWLLGGRRVRAGTPGAVKEVTHSPWWWASWTDRSGGKHREKLSRSKERAQKILRQRTAATDLIGTALDDPFATHAKTPLARHVGAWAADLTASGRSAKHVAGQKNMVLLVVNEMGAKVLADLRADEVRQAIDRLRKRGEAKPPLPPPADPKRGYTPKEITTALGIHRHSLPRTARRAGVCGAGENKARRYSVEAAEAIRAALPGFGLSTCNHYLGACKAFTAWCAGPTGRRMAADPLAHLERWNARADVRRRRRALAPEQFAAFVEAAGAGRTLRGLTGSDRLVLYTLAANTGFRAGELASLTPDSFNLSASPPTVTVAAAYSKHRREDVQPLRADVAEMMRQYLAGRNHAQPVWPGNWADDAAEIVRADLEAAGIPYSERGRTFDFHALRSMLGSSLAAAGVHPKVAQVLMRHSTIHLTMAHYTDAGVLDVGGALDKLPQLPGRDTPEK